jgi:uncharacterized protein YdhG (YjbR/CyaY superfamily)
VGPLAHAFQPTHERRTPTRSTVQRWTAAQPVEFVGAPDAARRYRVPAFRLRGEVVAGFAAFKDHLSYLPFSGSVLVQLGDELRDDTMTRSALHFAVDHPLPAELVKKLLAVRLAEVP